MISKALITLAVCLALVTGSTAQAAAGRRVLGTTATAGGGGSASATGGGIFLFPDGFYFFPGKAFVDTKSGAASFQLGSLQGSAASSRTTAFAQGKYASASAHSGASASTSGRKLQGTTAIAGGSGTAYAEGYFFPGTAFVDTKSGALSIKWGPAQASAAGSHTLAFAQGKYASAGAGSGASASTSGRKLQGTTAAAGGSGTASAAGYWYPATAFVDTKSGAVSLKWGPAQASAAGSHTLAFAQGNYATAAAGSGAGASTFP